MPRNAETAHVLDAQDLGELGRALGFAVLLLDGKGRVRGARGDAEQILGRPLARMRGRPLASFIAKSDRYLLDGCLGGRRREFVPLRLASRRGAPRWIEMRGSRLGGKRPAHGVLIATHDITARRVGERALLADAQRQRAGWSERLREDLSQRVAGVAYTLHALLATMPTSANGTGKVSAAVADLGSVVRDMRSLAYELDPASDRPGGLRDALPRLARRLSGKFGKDGSVTVDSAGWKRTRLDPDLGLCWHELLDELVSDALRDRDAATVRLSLGREHDALAARVESTRGTRVRGAPKPVPEVSPLARERVRLLGGSVRRHANPGGVETVVTAPR